MKFIKRAGFHQLKLKDLDQLDTYFAEISDKGRQIDLKSSDFPQWTSPKNTRVFDFTTS